MDYEEFEEKHPIMAFVLNIVNLTCLILYGLYWDIKIMERRRKIRFLGGFQERELKKEGYILDEEGHIIGREER